MGKLRGSEKVAARKTQATTAHSEDVARFGADAPILHARGIDAAIAVMSIATKPAAPPKEARAGAGGPPVLTAEEEHAADVTAAAHLVAGIDADDKHPEKRLKAAFQKFSDR
jgi:hypothetical protein